jgi:pimeloyl-ACP methyl ester carboxylesterase
MQSAPLLLGNYRRTQPHAEDVAAAIAAAQQDYGPLPVFLLGMSAGTAGAANAAQRLGPSVVKGVVMLSAVTQSNTQGLPWIVTTLPPGGDNAVPAAQIGVPMLFVHHQSDECAPFTPHSGAASLVAALQAVPKDATLATITGGVTDPGLDANGLPLACNSGNGHHSFEGAEAEVLARIAMWIGTKLP